MNRTKLAIYNMSASMLQNILTLFSGIIVTKIILYTYGSEINGLTSSISQFISYFTLLEAGLSGASIYALYKPLAERNVNAINGIVSATNKYYLFIGRIFSVLIIGLAIIYPQFVKTESIDSVQMGIYVIILSASGLLEFFTLGKYRALLMADQKSYVISIATCVYTTANLIVIYSLSILNVNIVLVRFVAIFSIILRIFILSNYVKKHYDYLNFKEKPNNDALKNRWNVFSLQLLISVQQGSPIIIATIFTNLKMVSIYSIYNMIMSGVNNLLSMITSGITASFGNIIANNEEKLLQKTVDEFEVIYYDVLLILYTITLTMFMPFIHLYTKNIVDVNYDVKYLAFLFVLNGLLYNLQTPHGLLVSSAGLFKETRVQSTIQALLLVVFGSGLSYYFGLYGILLGGIISNIYRTIDLVIFISKNLTKRKMTKCFYRVVRTIVLFCIISLLLRCFNFNPDNYIIWFVQAILSGVVSIIVVYLYSWIFEKQDLLIIQRRMISIMKSFTKGGDSK